MGLLTLNLRYHFFLRTEAPIQLGPLERVLNIPADHRLHHASASTYFDRNYGDMVMVFDRLFGTFAAKRADEPIRCGLVHPMGSKNPFVRALGEWRPLVGGLVHAPNLWAAARAAFGRPD